MREMFINRARELSQLRDFLHHPAHSATLITGVAGIGKTALLTKFAEVTAGEDHWVHYIKLREVSDEGDLVNHIAETLSSGSRLIGKDINQWKYLLAEDPETISAIAGMLRFPSARNSLPSLEKILRSIAAQHHKEKLVIIFDGLDELRFPETSISLFGELLGVASEGIKFIFSSRETGWLKRLTRYPNVSVLELDALPPIESRLFLQTYLTDLDLAEDVINRIAEASQGLPLFLTLIAELAQERAITNRNVLDQITIENIFPSRVNSFTLPARRLRIKVGETRKSFNTSS